MYIIYDVIFWCVAGGVLKWEQPCKIIHLATRKYLTVTDNMKVGLTTDHEDTRTVFKMHAVFRVNTHFKALI